MITNAYGSQNNQDKYIFLQNLAYLGSLAKGKRWIIGGGFNMILMLEETRGGEKVPRAGQRKIPGTHREPQTSRH
jgi:hypothetical protein